MQTLTGLLTAIYGQGRNLQKSKGYAAHPYFPGITNTHNTIDKAVHGRKRRIVAQGFSESAIASSEQYILEHVRNLCNEMIKPDTIGADGWSQPRDMAMWTNYFTLDVISDLTFGQPFDMIRNPKLRWLVEAIVSGNRHIYMRFAYPPLFNLDPSKWYSPARWLFPEMSTERASFSGIAEQYSKERVAMMEEGKAERNDIMSALLAARDPRTGEKLCDAEVWTEAHLMIAAGGDTTSTALAAVLFYLSRSPAAYSRLANEIRTTFSNVESIRRGRELTSCKYLKACLDEAMRLAPAAPGALWREAGIGGATVDGVYIPAGLDVGVCTYALSHNEEYFSDPFKFQPERFLNEIAKEGKEYPWTSSHSMNDDPAFFPPTPPETPKVERHDVDAYAPFSIGPRGCLAKPLAYLELSLCLARMIFMMDFEPVGSLGEGGEGQGRGRERKEEFQVIDMFSSNKKGPVLRFKSRRQEL